MDTLSGRRVLITGASSGIGPFLARRLREEGATLILSARNRERLDQVAAELGQAEVIVADLSPPGNSRAPIDRERCPAPGRHRHPAGGGRTPGGRST